VQLGGAGDATLMIGGNLSTNSGVLLLHALLAGQGIAVGPDLMFEKYVAARDVDVIFDDCAAEATGLYAVFPPGRFASPGRTAFVQFLLKHLGRESGSLPP
jgi:DNA-binding transcriptional LysR family regulator